MDDMRVSTPKEDVKKFKEVFLYLLGKIGALPNVGKTVLVKILYFIDFDYYEEKETQLMGMRYIKKQYGPFPLIFEDLINEMRKDKEIVLSNDSFYDKHQRKYLPTRDADLSCISGEELEFINKEIDKYSSKTAAQLTAYSHKDVPWIAAKDEEVLEYEGVFYRTSETSVRDYDELCD
jgi:uncharacterized phage-associated protein